MIADMGTILWKEFRELISQRPNLRGGWIGLLVFLGVFGIMLPLETGPEWISSPINLIYWAWVPFMMVNSVVADSFAGERERHTLETLLASRLSDKAILFGKLTAAILYGFGTTVVGVLMGVIAINVVYGHGSLILFPTWLAAGIALAGLLSSAFAAGLGVLISLRAATVRQAQQTLGVIALLPLIPILLLPVLPVQIRESLAASLVTTDPIAIMYEVLAVFLVIDLILIAASVARFQRSKLILD